MTGDEGKEVTGSLQYCAVNKSPSGKASMTGHEGKEVTGSVQYCAVNTISLWNGQHNRS